MSLLINHRPVVGFCCLIGLMIVGMQPAVAGSYLNTIDETATLTPSGHNVRVTGPIGCDAGEIVHIRVRVTQSSTGAIAEGTFHARCTGDREAMTTQPWSVRAATHGNVAFEPGEAHVEAWARTVNRGEQTDMHNWGRTVELVGRSP